VADLLMGRRVASWEIVRRVVLDLGGNETEFLTLWKQAAGAAQAVAAPIAPAQLPPPTAAFTGREVELAELTAWLAPAAEDQAVAILAIVGLAGVGKTELAIQAANAAVAAGWFPGGAVFLDLHGYDDGPVQPDQALDSLLRTLGIPAEYIPSTTEERAGLYRSVLARTADPMLLVVDNASTEAQIRPLLPGRGPHRVLITSRHTMAVLTARLLDLSILSREESVALLDQALRLARPDDNRIRAAPDAARRLADVCGRLPLALRITAALLADDPTRTAEELAAEFTNEIDRMDELRYDDVSVQAAFELSYRQLDKATARVFALLSVHPGPDLSAEAIAALTNQSISQTRRVIEKLVRSHLVEYAAKGPGRWRMHDLLRLYARSLPEPDDAERGHARDRLLSYYYSVAIYLDSFLTRQRPPHVVDPPVPAIRHHFDDYRIAIKWAKYEKEDLLACVDYVVRHARDLDPDDRKTWIIVFAEALAGFLRNETLWTRSIELQTQATKAAEELRKPLAKANALSERAVLHRLQGELDSADADLAEALIIYRDIGGEEGLIGEAHALNTYGVVLDQKDLRPEASQQFNSALGIYRRLNDRTGEANVLHDRGLAELFAGDFGNALDLLTQALTVYQEVNHPLGMAHAHVSLARVLRSIGHTSEAIRNLASAQALYNDLGGGHYSEVTTLIQQSAILQERDQEQAIKLLQQAIELSTNIGSQVGLVTALDALARIYVKDQNTLGATDAWNRALGIARRIGLKRQERNLTKELAQLVQAKWVTP
jgi:tetratricopeptide (TPR) repeat protein